LLRAGQFTALLLALLSAWDKLIAMASTRKNQKKMDSKQELIARLLKKAQLDFRCCGGGKCKVVTK
jgi:hypothetical protein